MPQKNEKMAGYLVITAGFIISVMTWGAYRTYGLFLKPLTAEFGWSRAETSGAYSLTFLLTGILAMVSGKLSDKFGPKLVLIAAGILMGAGYLLMSGVNALWQLYLFFIILGFGIGGVDTPILATVARWFHRGRGVVTGIVKAGAGFGIFVMPPLAGWIISGYGWRPAYAVIGAMAVFVICISALFIKSRPSGQPAAPEAGAGFPARSLTLGQAAKTSQFWLFAVIWFILVFVTQTIMLHVVPHATDIGISGGVAASILSVIGVVSILGRIGMGGFSDKLGGCNVLMITIFTLAAAFVWLLFADSSWMLFVFAVVYGIAHGAIYTLILPILAELFGLDSLGAILGAITFGGTVGGSAGPLLAGRVFDITGSYELVFIICIGLIAISVVLMLFLRAAGKKRE